MNETPRSVLDPGSSVGRAEPQRGFPVTEIRDRVRRAQTLMDEVDLDALFITTEPEFRYFTGFLTQFWQSPARPWFLIVPRSGPPVGVVPEIGEPLLRRTGLEEIHTWPAPQPHDEGVSLVGCVLAAVVPAGGRIGVPMGPESTVRMPLADFEELRCMLAGRTFTDATSIVRDLRMVKSESEIAKIAHICAVASTAFDALPDLISPGTRLDEAFRAFKIALLRAGADDVPYLVGASAPAGYDSVIAPADRRPLSNGDVLMLDTGATFDGYFCDFDRNFSLGDPDPAAVRAHDTLYRATDAALELARPGTTTSELFRAMSQVITSAGFDRGNVGRFGHGLGMQLTEWPSHTLSDATVLRAGMVLTLEPSVSYGEGRGMVHEENLVVREDGAQLLTSRAPSRLPELPWW